MLALLLAEPLAASDHAPRGLSAAEREAVTLAVAYLSEGPEAWWRQLADDAPLRQLGHRTAVAALEVRAGPPSGARWQLQTISEQASANTAVFTVELPSGMEETLLLRLRDQPEGWKIHTVRMSSEPPRGFGSEADTGAPGSEPQRPGPRASGETPITDLLPFTLPRESPAVLGIVAALLFILAIRRGVWFAVAGSAVGAGALALLLLGQLGKRQPAAATAGGEAPVVTMADQEAELAGLLELRRALAGGDEAAIEAARQTLPAGPTATRVTRLWQAQLALFALDLNAADAVLKEFPLPAAWPQAERLRARLAFLRLSEVDTALAYERLLEIGVRDDALLFEAAQAFEILGFPDRARRYYQELETLGSRTAELYYSRAGSAILDNLPLKAERYFRKGWKLKPLTRDAVMGHMLLAFLVEETATLRQLLDLGSPREPEVACNGVSSQALTLPPGARARLLGGFLSLDVGDGELEVPGGCWVAPANVEIMDAGAWRQYRESSALAALPRLLVTARSGGALSRPRIRQEMEEVVAALDRRGRWDDLIAVTDGLGTEIAGVPPSVVRRRAEALRRVGRRTAAQELLAALIASNAKNRQVDPGTLFRLAELLVSDGRYDLALKLMAKAHSQLPFEVDPRRLRQVQMEKRLANASAVYESEHFEVFYPYERSLYFAERVSEILEAERRRLSKWIPVSKVGKTEVFLLQIGEFQIGYGGNVAIMGLFDGKIRVPFADVNTFTPFIVSVLTHELAHAMITEASDDRAPHWLQEGLAQHLEMPQDGINPIAGYRSTGNLLSFPMIETVLESFAAPRLVPVAYDQSRWVLHFVESRYGVRGIQRLLGAFREGLTTEEAIAKAMGKSVVELDHEIWEWCVKVAPQMWPSEIVHYDTYEAPVLVPEDYEEEEGEDDYQEDDYQEDDYDGGDDDDDRGDDDYDGEGHSNAAAVAPWP